MRKEIRVWFVGFGDDYKANTSYVTKLLTDKYELVIDKDNPQYVFCGCFVKPDEAFYEYCKYPQIRIMICGENYIPDFNLIDYSLCSYPVSLFDRNFYMPQSFGGGYFGTKKMYEIESKKREYDKEWLNNKQFFANFIAGHPSDHNIRENFFKELSKYKRVESVGSYLNNMPNGEIVSWLDDSKTNFQRKCKFTLCFESTSNLGFNTEKITDAFYSDTIPVYYGDPNINSIFNEKAFINCNKLGFEKAIELIKYLDSHDDEYLKMMNQPIFVKDKPISECYKNAQDFLLHIFDQPYEEARRRSTVFNPKRHNDYLIEVQKYWKRKIRMIKVLISFPLVKILLSVRDSQKQ